MDRDRQQWRKMDRNRQKYSEMDRNRRKKQTEMDKTEQNTEHNKTFDIFAFDGTTHNA